MPSTKEKEKENRVRKAHEIGKLLIKTFPEDFGKKFLKSGRTCRELAKLIKSAKKGTEFDISLNYLTSAIKYSLFGYNDSKEGAYGLDSYKRIFLNEDEIKHYNSRKYLDLQKNGKGIGAQTKEELQSRLTQSHLEKMLKGSGFVPWSDEEKEKLWNLSGTNGYYNKKTYTPNYAKIAKEMGRTQNSIRNMYSKLKQKNGIRIKKKIDWRENIKVLGTQMPIIVYIDQLTRNSIFQGKKKKKTTIKYRKLTEYLEINIDKLNNNLTPDKLRKALEINKRFIQDSRREYIPKLITLEDRLAA